MVGSSSRGPQHEDTHLIKPEIGAPGASVSAIAGSGFRHRPVRRHLRGRADGQRFGSAAARGHRRHEGHRQGHASRTCGRTRADPIEVKARLMNTGETDIVNDPLTGELAPITRIGGGEVRVDRAVAATAAAWDADVVSAALSFGFVDVTDTVTMTKTVRIRNYDNSRRTYTVTPTFRFDNDVQNGAVSVSAPSSVRVQPGVGRDTTFDVTITIDGSKLRGNHMNSGSQGADPAGLTLNEYDGYLLLDDGRQPLHLPWHVLPRKAAEVVPDTTDLEPGSFPQVIGLDNTGAGTAQNDAYALLAVSDEQPRGGRGEQSPTPDIKAVGINTFPVPAGFCSANPSFIWAFAVATHDRQEHLLPVSHQVWLDTNQDGVDDYVVLNRDASGPAPSATVVSSVGS
jgi:minor extracellular serine protease Vpr